MNPVYILGHKNPDADSICAAMAYAAFKRALGFDNYVAARCGNSNARIDKVLKRFSAHLPEFVGDVRLRAQNIMKRDVISLSKDVSSFAAMDAIDKYDIRSIPILDDDRVLIGEISVFDLGEFFIPRPREVREVRKVRATLGDVIKTLNATVHTASRPDEMEDMFVRIGAMEVSSFGSFIEDEGLRPEQNLIVVGDRFDIQIKAVQMGVRGIIITGGYDIDPSVIEMAKMKGVSVISCPYDSATTALLVRMATRACPMMRTNLTTVTRDYLLSKISARIKDFFGKTIYVCDAKGRLEGVFSNTDLLDVRKPQIVLVDHNELSQAVTGAEEAEILEIIDHHRIGNTPTSNPILFLNKPVGSTCTIISQLFAKSGIKPDEQTAGLMLSGIICDTLNLKSPTSTDDDAEEIARLSKMLSADTGELADYLFSSDSIIVSDTPENVVCADCKIYEEGEYKFSVSQVEELDFSNFYKRREELQEALENFRKEKGLLFSVLFVTNVMSQDSVMIIAGSEDYVSRINYTRDAERNVYELPKIVSRKKQLIPPLMAALQAQQEHF